MKQKKELIESYILDKDVLDIGSVGQKHPYELFDFIENSAKKVVGIDILIDKRGRNIIYGDMCNYKFKKKFDVVVCGDVIEHIENQGLLLNNIRKHLKNNGVLIITTPDSRTIMNFVSQKDDHYFIHNRFTLTNLLQKYKFEILKLCKYGGNNDRFFKTTLFVACKKKC